MHLSVEEFYSNFWSNDAMKYPVVEYLDQIGSVDVNVQPWQGEEGTVLKREIRMRVPVKGSDLPSPSPSPSPSLLSPIPSHITDFHHDRLCHDHLSSILRTPLHSLSHRCLWPEMSLTGTTNKPLRRRVGVVWPR